MYTENEFLQLSGIQHFSFCRRQWALIHIEQEWAENGLTTEGKIEHERVHNESVQDIRNGILTLRGLRVHSFSLGISGECDAVEFIPSETGITLNNRKGQWQICPVEYKHGKSKVNDCDRLQTALQVMCLEEMFSAEINNACIFYHETRRREYVEITDELRNKAVAAVMEMHSYMSRGYTPKPKMSIACKKCSLADICIPELEKKSEMVSAYIERHIMEGTDEEDA